ncbi:hypothetical protein JEQ12_019704 [Ovis aries]|uniref:Alpha-carbonic anhydrase domain-containing protein n=1 Tax=Ovis aries TaxID=9940 RepID=A0A836CQ17_SHEEP|nr:hypothetical protein JEQ12_019704 [Ovis aries]
MWCGKELRDRPGHRGKERQRRPRQEGSGLGVAQRRDLKTLDSIGTFLKQKVLLLSMHPLWEKVDLASAGEHQSPINIRWRDSVYDPGLQPLTISYDPTTCLHVWNNGYSFLMECEDSADKLLGKHHKELQKLVFCHQVSTRRQSSSKIRPRRLASMGSFLSRYLAWWLGTDKAAQPGFPGPSRLPLGQGPGQVLLVRRAPRGRSSRLRGNLPTLYRSPTCRALVYQAWRPFPSWLLLHHFKGLRFSRHRKTSRKTRLRNRRNRRHRRSRRSLVTVQITLPERTGSVYTCLPRPVSAQPGATGPLCQ